MSGSFSVGDEVGYSGRIHIILSQLNPNTYYIAPAYSHESVASFSVSGEHLNHLETSAANSYSVVNTDDLPGSRTLEEARAHAKELLGRNPAPTSFTIVEIHEAWESEVTIKQIQ